MSDEILKSLGEIQRGIGRLEGASAENQRHVEAVSKKIDREVVSLREEIKKNTSDISGHDKDPHAHSRLRLAIGASIVVAIGGAISPLVWSGIKSKFIPEVHSH